MPQSLVLPAARAPNPKQSAMSYREAIKCLHQRFPFPGYLVTDPIRNAYSNIAKTVSRHLPIGSKVLDFGCGPCDKTALLKFMGYECSGYDDLQDDWHRLPGVRKKILNFTDDCGIDFRLAGKNGFPFAEESFDLVTAFDVVEHLHNSPRVILNDLLTLAKPEGLILITVPSAVNIRKRIDVLRGKTNLPRYAGYYWYPDPWRGHIREYCKDDLRMLAEYLDLEIVELRSCDHMLEAISAKLHPIYLLITDVFRGWKDSWTLLAKKRPNWTPKKSLPREELEKILGKYTGYDYNADGEPDPGSEYD
jgi:SAM-dependent methyltransferase